MPSSRVNATSKLLEFLSGSEAFAVPKWSLIDVGASGGIGEHWRALGDDLCAIGFDPLVAEVEWLNRHENRKNVRYEAAFIGCPEYDDLFPEPFLRSSDLAELRDLLSTQQLKPIIDRVFPLAETADAIRYVENGHVQGKVIVNVLGA